MLLGREIDEAIPYNDYFEYYAPDFKLHLTPVSCGMGVEWKERGR